ECVDEEKPRDHEHNRRSHQRTQIREEQTVAARETEPRECVRRGRARQHLPRDHREREDQTVQQEAPERQRYEGPGEVVGDPVAPSGPPPVNTMTSANTWNAPMIPVTRTNSVTGESSGNVTRQKRCQALAPSTRAASRYGWGMARSPARKTVSWYPSCIHTDTS